MGGEVSLHRSLAAIKGKKFVLTKTEKPYSFEGIEVREIDTPNVLNINANPASIIKQLKSLDAKIVIGQNELSLVGVLAAKEIGAISIVNVHTPPKYGKSIRQAVVYSDYAIYNTQTSARLWGEPGALVLHPPIKNIQSNTTFNGDAYTCLSSLKNKGVEVVLSLAEKYPNKRFIIVRSPADPTHGLNDLEERASRLSNVELQPRVAPEEVYKYLKQTRILLVPSRYETYGMSAIEAAAYGIPSVHVDTPHVREGIGDAAVLISPLSVEEAASGIDLIESNYEAFSIKAKKRFEWLLERQESELENLVNFIENIKPPADNSLRYKSIARASRVNR
jgi:hypothetical protein